MQRKRPPGIILISVIMLSVIIGLFIATSTILNRGQYGALKQGKENDLAEMAARSGVEYALARLEEDPEWRGNGSGVTVDSPSLYVVEDNGNVTGFLSSEGLGTAQFRLRFNYQDGVAGADALDDPAAEFRAETPYISRNNLAGFSTVKVPLGDGPGGRHVGNFTDYSIPPGSVALICEGRVATGLTSVDALALSNTSRVQASRVLEAVYKIDGITGDSMVVDAVSMAAQNIDVTLYSGTSGDPARLQVTDTRGENAKLRSRADIMVVDGSGGEGIVEGANAELLLPSDRTLKGQLHPGVQRADEDVAGDFYQLTWDEVKDVDGSSGSLPGGVYVYWETDGRLHYYDMTYEDYKAAMAVDPTNPGTPNPTLPTGLSFVKSGQSGPDGLTSDKYRFVLTEDVRVSASTSNVNELSILPRQGAKEDLTVSGGPPVGLGAVKSAASGIDAFNTFVQVLANPDNYATNGPVHTVLLDLSPTGQTVGANGVISWSPSGISKSGVDPENAMHQFFHSETVASLSDMNNPQLFSGNNQSARIKGPAVIGGHIQHVANGTVPSGDKIDEIDLGSDAAAETLHPGDFEFTLAPQGEEGVRLQADGDIRLATNIKGEGASIKTSGQIRLVGVGFDMDATLGEEAAGVSLYAKDSIVISTLRPKGNGYEYSGLDLRGVVYSWKDIIIKASHPDEDTDSAPQSIYIQGALVAYGGEPGVQRPGEGSGGTLSMQSDKVDLVFDPAYLAGLGGLAGKSVRLKPVSRSFRN